MAVQAPYLSHPDTVHEKKKKSLHHRQPLDVWRWGKEKGRMNDWRGFLRSQGQLEHAAAGGPHEEADGLQHGLPLWSLDWKSNVGMWSAVKKKSECLATEKSHDETKGKKQALWTPQNHNICC